MTTKEYLQQAYRLDKRINSHIKELEELKSMAAAISSPQITADKVQTTPSGDPPYVSALMRIWEMEEKINAEIDLYVDLKAQCPDPFGSQAGVEPGLPDGAPVPVHPQLLLGADRGRASG